MAPGGVFQTFGKRLKYFRERKGIDQLALGVAVGYTSGSAIMQMELGAYSPALEKIGRIADELNIPPAA